MKLSFKIFLGICIPAIIAIVIISSILITRSFSRNIDSETERCIEEFKLIEMNIENAFNSSTSEAKNIIKAYSDYYNNKGIKFAYYENGKEVYKSEEFISISNNEILDVTRKNLLASIENMQGEYYVLVSTKLSNEQVLIYIRNINSIYEIKDDLIILSTMLIIIILAIVSGIAYIISKTLTKPLNKMQKEMLKLSNGEYDIIAGYDVSLSGVFAVYDADMKLLYQGSMTDEIKEMFEEKGSFGFYDENGEFIYPVRVKSVIIPSGPSGSNDAATGGDVVVTPGGDVVITPSGDVVVTPNGDVVITPDGDDTATDSDTTDSTTPDNEDTNPDMGVKPAFSVLLLAVSTAFLASKKRR